MSLATSEAVGRESSRGWLRPQPMDRKSINQTGGDQDRRRQRRGRSSGTKHRTVESGLGRAGGMVQRPIGCAVERPTGATLNRRTLLAFLPRIPGGDGRGTHTICRVLAATAQANRPVSPPMRHGAKLRRNKHRPERSDPPSGDEFAARMNDMEVGRPGRPSPTHQWDKRGHRATRLEDPALTLAAS